MIPKKCKVKKTKAKIIIKAINKNDEKDHESIIEVFLNIQKRSYANIGNKHMSDTDRERKKKMREKLLS